MNETSLIKNYSFDDIGIEVFSQKTETYLEKYSSELTKNLQELISTLDPYQSSILDFDINKPLRCVANAGCLGSQSKIKINRAKTSKEFTIEQAYRGFHGLNPQSWDRSITTKIRSLHEDGTIRLNEIEDIIQSGVKSVYPLHLENGKILPLTKEHLVKTTRDVHDGWVRLNKLTQEDYVFVDAMERPLNSPSPEHSNLKYSIPEFSKIKFIGDSYKDMTYDICCKDPNNNFVAEGMVVHNSGKTRVLITRALKMVILDKIPAHKIVLITFTNKAANEIKDRYINFFKTILSKEELKDLSLPQISTIHSFGYTTLSRILGIFRTISNEYQSKKLMKQTMLEVLGTDKVDQKSLIQMIDSYESIASNCELHYAILPRLSSNGDLINVITQNNYGPFIQKSIDFLDTFTYSAMALRISGSRSVISEEDKFSIVTEYAQKANLAPNVFIRILALYYTYKYQTNILDFADCTIYPILFLSQYPHLLHMVWNRYDYFSCDEAQDTDCAQSALMFMCDQESYELFK